MMLKQVKYDRKVFRNKYASKTTVNPEFFSIYRLQTKYNGPANVLVNCAGISVQENFLDSTEETNDEVIRINLKVTYTNDLL